MDPSFISDIPEGLMWLLLLFSTFIENIFPPYPGDSVVVFSGYLISKGVIGPVTVALIVLVGNLGSAGLMYFFGYEIMQFILHHLGTKAMRKEFSAERLEKTHQWFERYGIWAVVFSRFSAGIRFFVAIVAGMVKMEIKLFFLAFTFATLIWNTLLIYGGYTLGENWESIMGIVQLYSGSLAVVILVALALWYFIKKFKKTP